jgi:hypothetical protein
MLANWWKSQLPLFSYSCMIRPQVNSDVKLLLYKLWAECAPTVLLKGMLGMFCVITQSEGFWIPGRWLWCYLMLLTWRSQDCRQEAFRKLVFFPSTMVSTAKMMQEQQTEMARGHSNDSSSPIAWLPIQISRTTSVCLCYINRWLVKRILEN